MNTFGMKVKARCFMEYDSVADLVDIEFEELARPVLHIGGGSNCCLLTISRVPSFTPRSTLLRFLRRFIGVVLKN